MDITTSEVTEDSLAPPRKGIFQGGSRGYFVALLLLCLLVRFVLAYWVYGSFDVDAWRQVLHEFTMEHNPYYTGKLNWPPLWPTILWFMGYFQNLTNIPEYILVKIVPILADTTISLVLYAWFFEKEERPATAFKLSLWYALNPIAIATCTLQGQFESLPSLFALLAVIQATRSNTVSVKSAWWLCLGGLAKTWPLILLPAFLSRAETAKQKIVFTAIAVLPTVISVGVLYHFAPDAISHHVLGYRGRSGMWGLTALNNLLSEDAGKLWSRIVFYLLISAWLIVTAKTWKRGSVGQCACLGILTFYVFTSGMGPQYCAWILALALISDFSRARLFTVVATLCVGVMYLCTPYNGEYFNYIHQFHSPLFWATNMKPYHLRMAALNFLPLWLFCIGWLVGLLRDVLKPTTDEAKLITD